MSLSDKLTQLAEQGQPSTLEGMFADSKEQMLYSQLTDSLRQAAERIKQEMAQDLEEIASRFVQEAVSQIKVKDGRNGFDGKPGLDGVNGTDGSPDTPKEVKDKLETLKDEERLDATAIKNLPTVLETLYGKRGGSSGGGSTMRVNNLSSQANGSSTTFTTTHRIGNNHLLFYSSFPTLFLPTTDYTVSGTLITLASGVPIPQSGQSLAIIYESSD